MSSGAASDDEFEKLHQEVEEMQREVALAPERKLEIIRRYARKAKDEGGQKRAFHFIQILNICSARRDMDDRPINVTVSGGQVGVINLGAVQGNIEANVQTLAAQGGAQEKFADAIRQVAAAVSGSDLSEPEKKDALEMIDTLTVQAKEPPEKRVGGVLKAVFTALPAAIGAAKGLTDLWEKFGPIIKAHFGQ
jgi:hypothetical protein